MRLLTIDTKKGMTVLLPCLYVYLKEVKFYLRFVNSAFSYLTMTLEIFLLPSEKVFTTMLIPFCKLLSCMPSAV